MTLSDPPNEAIAESQKIIDALERRRNELPFVELLLVAHHIAHQELEQRHHTSELAVNAWRAALAQRWEYEVAGRRLYKQVLRQLEDHYGDAAPQIRLISRGGAEINSSPIELLDDLRRLQAVLTVGQPELDFATERLAQIEQTCQVLSGAIDLARSTEQQRRDAVLDSRMAREAFRRTCEETFGKLAAFYGERFVEEFQEFLDVPVA